MAAGRRCCCSPAMSTTTTSPTRCLCCRGHERVWGGRAPPCERRPILAPCNPGRRASAPATHDPRCPDLSGRRTLLPVGRSYSRNTNGTWARPPMPRNCGHSWRDRTPLRPVPLSSAVVGRGLVPRRPLPFLRSESGVRNHLLPVPIGSVSGNLATVATVTPYPSPADLGRYRAATSAEAGFRGRCGQRCA